MPEQMKDILAHDSFDCIYFSEKGLYFYQFILKLVSRVPVGNVSIYLDNSFE